LELAPGKHVLDLAVLHGGIELSVEHLGLVAEFRRHLLDAFIGGLIEPILRGSGEIGDFALGKNDPCCGDQTQR